MRRTIILLMTVILLTACGSHIQSSTPMASSTKATLVLTHGTLIDGTGADPIQDATLVIGGDRILAVGPSTQIEIPGEVEVSNLDGAYILPGFINAHVHDAYDETRLKTWAQAGVTTVRDESIISAKGQLSQLLALRDQLASDPENARLVSAGYMISVPGGYGSAYGALAVTSAEDAQEQVSIELDAGVDLIKLAVESGYAGVSNLPVLSDEVLSAIVSTAHSRGKLVSAHITNAVYLSRLLQAGVDDLAHIPSGLISDALIQQMIEQGTYVVPTVTVIEAYGGLREATYNLDLLARSGVQIAMGNDYTAVPQNNFDHFELGMPMHEINRMSEAGMTSMQIIVASTRNAAHVCGLQDDLGTLQVGKLADILVLSADPLQDLSALGQVKMVIHSGEAIRR